MSKYRETPCKFYICRGECSKGRAAEHKTYCQHCSKYYPRAKVRHINQKKRYNEQQRSQITAWNNTRKRILWIYHLLPWNIQPQIIQCHARFWGKKFFVLSLRDLVNAKLNISVSHFRKSLAKSLNDFLSYIHRFILLIAFQERNHSSWGWRADYGH